MIIKCVGKEVCLHIYAANIEKVYSSKVYQLLEYFSSALLSYIDILVELQYVHHGTRPKIIVKLYIHKKYFGLIKILLLIYNDKKPLYTKVVHHNT